MAGGAGGFIGGFNPLNEDPAEYSGVWNLKEQIQAIAAGRWQLPPPKFELYAWGNGASGRLGDGTTASTSSPIQVGALTNWSRVSAGFGHSAAVKTDGTLWTWGLNNVGQLGDNTTANKSSPIQIGALATWTQVATGGFQSGHTVAVAGGELYAWGTNSYGRLGDGTTISKSSPVQIGALTNWSQVSTAPGGAATLSIKTDGTLWAWGYNGSGQLGLGNVAHRSSPVQVGGLTTWAQASAGNAFSLAVTTGGALYAWGSNSQGSLGDGTGGSGAATNDKSSPIQVGALTNWLQTTAGSQNAAAVKTDGTLWAWGRNVFGQVGDNSTVLRNSPVQIGSLTTWYQVSAGTAHVSAVKTDGTLWAWGQGSSGKLGDGTFVSKSSPVQVGEKTDWEQVSAGASHTVAVTEN